MTQQFDPGAIKEAQRTQWGRAAAGWRKHDERLRRVTAPVTSRLLELAAVGPGHRVLDIASRTPDPLRAPRAPGGAFSFADESRLASVFTEAGFRDVHIEDLEFPMAVFDSG